MTKKVHQTFIKSLNNQKGITLVGAMIAAAVGLLVVLGISKSLVNFAEQTNKTRRKQVVVQASANLSSILRSLIGISIGISKVSIPKKHIFQ